MKTIKNLHMLHENLWKMVFKLCTEKQSLMSLIGEQTWKSFIHFVIKT